MKSKCYFCHSWLNDFYKVKMYDGRTVPSCLKCRELVADAVVDCGDCVLFEESEDLANLEVRAR